MTFKLYQLCYLAISINNFVVQASISLAESPEAAGQIYDFPFHNRSSWGARHPTDIIPLSIPVPYVVIHDSAEFPSIEVAGCSNVTQCIQSMKNIQNLHMDQNGWWDIGYNFAVGGDGAAYEGRGWHILGAQAKYFNTISIGICFIGSFDEKQPTDRQLRALDDLIAAGVKMGFIRSDYRLVTHGQLKNPPCPGKKLAERLETWLHHSKFPGSPKDLLDIPEISEGVKDEIRRELGTVPKAL